MADVHSPENRSKNMRAIRNKNTNPELLVRRMLFAHGFRFRLHVKKILGTPDIALHKYRTVIFIHGCFWHGHNCYLFKLPKARREFWQEKIKKNQLRDERNIQNLHLAGWRVLIVWECSLKGRLKWDAQDLGDRLSLWIRLAIEDVSEVRHI